MESVDTSKDLYASAKGVNLVSSFLITTIKQGYLFPQKHGVKVQAFLFDQQSLKVLCICFPLHEHMCMSCMYLHYELHLLINSIGEDWKKCSCTQTSRSSWPSRKMTKQESCNTIFMSFRWCRSPPWVKTEISWIPFAWDIVLIGFSSLIWPKITRMKRIPQSIVVV